MFELPSNLVIGGKSYPIRNRGDYRMVLDCFVALNDSELEEYYRVMTCLIIFFDGFNTTDDIINAFGEEHIQEAIDKVFDFINCGQKHIGAEKPYTLVDWNSDSHMIASAINQVAKCEIRAVEYCHWWTFMGYYLAIGECAFSTVVSIRNKIKTHKKLETFEKEFKQENPEYFLWDSASIEQKEAEDFIRANWKTKK